MRCDGHGAKICYIAGCLGKGETPPAGQGWVETAQASPTMSVPRGRVTNPPRAEWELERPGTGCSPGLSRIFWEQPTQTLLGVKREQRCQPLRCSQRPSTKHLPRS